MWKYTVGNVLLELEEKVSWIALGIGIQRTMWNLEEFVRAANVQAMYQNILKWFGNMEREHEGTLANIM